MHPVPGWFERRTFYADGLDVGELAERKQAAGLRVSVVLPSRNETATIEGVVAAVMRLAGTLVDECVLIDAGSTDGTRARAERLGARTYDDAEVLPELGAGLGKGDALWRSLSVTSGDLVVFVDTDIANPDPRLVWGLLGPLLLDPDVQLVKGFYDRPLRTGESLQAGGGGRVTELMARPLLNLFWPDLAGLAQPLSGEYAGRRALLESIPFFTGYGVEIGLLIDTLATAGPEALAQVDLGERIHHNQPIPALSRMAFSVLQVAVRRLADQGRAAWNGEALADELLQHLRGPDGRLELQRSRVTIVERPPLRDYRRQRSQRTP